MNKKDNIEKILNNFYCFHDYNEEARRKELLKESKSDLVEYILYTYYKLPF